MRLFKAIFVSWALLVVTPFSNAQITDGAFNSGVMKWKWSDASTEMSVPNACSTLVQFVPVMETDTPYMSSLNNYVDPSRGMVAKVTGRKKPWISSGHLCRELSQEAYIPIGSTFEYEIWTTADANKSGKSEVDVSITFEDTTSALKQTYTPVRVTVPQHCNGLSATQTCNYFSKYRILGSISAFWGKKVKVKIAAATRYADGAAGGGVIEATVAYIDNIALVPALISNSIPMSGAWYNPLRSGHGLHMSKASDGRYQIIWYTYLSNGKPVWYISDVEAVTNGVLTSKIYKSTWDYSTSTNTRVAIGDIKFEMLGTTQFNLSWDLYSVNGDNAGYDGGEPMEHLFGGESSTGLWYEPALSGYGYSIDYMNTGNIDTAATVFYYIAGEPVWARYEKAGAPTANNIFPMTAYTGLGLCPECSGQPISKTPSPVGEVGFSLENNKSWVYLEDTNGTVVWQRGFPQQPVGTYRLTVP